MAVPVFGQLYMGGILLSIVGSIVLAIISGIVGWFIWSKVREQRNEMIGGMIKGEGEEKEESEESSYPYKL